LLDNPALEAIHDSEPAAKYSNPRNMRFLSSILILCIAASSAIAQTAYTPKPGSPERQAICDAMRDFVKTNCAQKPLPKPIVFVIDSIRVQGNYCHFEGFPEFNDGSDAIGSVRVIVKT